MNALPIFTLFHVTSLTSERVSSSEPEIYSRQKKKPLWFESSKHQFINLSILFGEIDQDDKDTRTTFSHFI